MEEVESEETSELSQISAASPRWTGAASIALAHQLNEQCVELVCELAATSLSPELPPFIMRNRDLWRLSEIDARKRVADFPFVIVDLCFKDLESWQRAGEGQLMSLPDSSHYNAVPPKLFEDLLLETLLFARQAAREDTSWPKPCSA